MDLRVTVVDPDFVGSTEERILPTSDRHYYWPVRKLTEIDVSDKHIDQDQRTMTPSESNKAE